VGQASITNPPLEPQPVTPETSVEGVKVKVIAVVTPVIVTVVALASHVLAFRVVVFVAVVTSGMLSTEVTNPFPLTVIVAGVDVPVFELTVARVMAQLLLVTSPVNVGNPAQEALPFTSRTSQLALSGLDTRANCPADRLKEVCDVSVDTPLTTVIVAVVCRLTVVDVSPIGDTTKLDPQPLVPGSGSVTAVFPVWNSTVFPRSSLVVAESHWIR
jgi:hypothetical protein